MRTGQLNGGVVNYLGYAIAHSPEVFALSYATLFSFTDLGGQSWLFNDRGVNLKARLAPGGPLFIFSGSNMQPKLKSTKCALGTTDSTATITFQPNADNSAGFGLDAYFLAGCHSGLFDNAYMTIDWGFMVSNEPEGLRTIFDTVRIYAGWVGKIDLTRDMIQMELNSVLYRANLRIPKRMYAAPCQHSLYGPGCHPGAESPSFPGPGYEEHTQVYNVVSVNPVYPLQIFTLNLWDPTALFALGFITFSSGLNYLLRRTIKRVDGDTITLMSPLPNIPEIGAIVALTHGCDKSQSTCLNKFNNLNNFGGFPYIPHETVFFIFSVLCLITGLIWKEIG